MNEGTVVDLRYFWIRLFVRRGNVSQPQATRVKSTKKRKIQELARHNRNKQKIWTRLEKSNDVVPLAGLLYVEVIHG
jgi:Holliday junction resolvase-like predicted endonuclease